MVRTVRDRKPRAEPKRCRIVYEEAKAKPQRLVAWWSDQCCEEFVGRFREDYAPMIEALPIADKARLAAFIDGEGTIYINVSSRLRGRSKSPQYNLSVTITGTNPIFMNWLKQTFDGSLYFVKYEKCKHLGKRQIIRWQVNGRMANTILSNVVQYMIIKRPQAEVGLSFLNLMKPRMGGYKRQTALTEADIALRHGMKLEIERLNKSDGITVVQ